MSSLKIQPKRKGGNTDLLNPQQRLFVDALLGDPSFNAAAAAKKAGYKNPPQDVQRLLKNKIVAACIGKAIRKRSEEFQIDAKRVLQELACIGFVDPGELFKNGELRSMEDIPEAVRRAMSGFDVEMKTYTDKEGSIQTTTLIKPRFWSKNNALELIAKHLGMLDERYKVEHNIEGGLLQALMEKLEGQMSGGQVIDAKSIESAASEDSP